MNIKTKDDILLYQKKRQLEINNKYFELDRVAKNKINSIIKCELKKYTPKHRKVVKEYYNIKEFITSRILDKNNKFTSERNNYIYFLKNNFIKEYGYIYYITNFLPQSTTLTVRLIYILEDLYEIKVCDFCNKEIINTRMNCSINCKKRRGNDKTETIRKNKVTPDTNKSIYQRACRKKSEEVYKANKALINPKNLKRGRNGTKGTVQLDHIISIEFGYLYNIPVEVISDVSNLQIISWEENSSKNKYIPRDIKIKLDEYLLEEFNEKSEGKNLTHVIRKLLEEFNKNKNLRKKIL